MLQSIDFGNIPIINKCPPDARKYIPFIAITFVLLLFGLIAILICLLSEDELSKSCLEAHNIFRYRHGVPSLQIDSRLLKFATKRANDLAETDVFQHARDLQGYGENLHFIGPDSEYPCDEVVKSWYDEIRGYNFYEPRRSRGVVGHFTQVVWKESKRLGCAQRFSQKSSRTYTVCIYDPAGNYVDEMQQNVNKPDN